MPVPWMSATGREWKALMVSSGFRRGGYRGLLVNLLAVAGFGVLVPWMRGFNFFDPFVIFAYTAIAFLFAASAITSVAGGEQSASLTVSRIFASALYAWLALLVIYGLGILTLNLTFPAPRLLHPNWELLGAATLLAFCGSVLLASLGALLSLLFSEGVARNTIRIGFALVLVAMVYGQRYLPPLWQAAIDQQLTTPGLTRIALIGSAIAAGLAAALILTIHKAEHRDQTDG